MALVCLMASLVLPSPAEAVRPITQYNDLVAGEGDAGFEDGDFTSAQFQGPTGLALDAQGKRLFVADTGNHAIRIIHLDRNNRVSTLAGKGKLGQEDGPLGRASFNSPTALLALSGDRLLVQDRGTNLLRMVDLKAGTVATVAPRFPENHPAATVEGIFAMAYDREGEAVFFSQPQLGRVERWDLKTNLAQTLFKNHEKLPNPAALCMADGKLHVADTNQTAVQRVMTIVTMPDGSFNLAMEEAGKGSGILALAGRINSLNALGAAPEAPWVRINHSTPLTIVSAWGQPLGRPSREENKFLFFNTGGRPGLLPVPGDDRRYFVAATQANAVFSLRDYGLDEFKNSMAASHNGLHDYWYPREKPPATFRILMVGDSHIFWGHSQAKRWDWGWNRMEMLTKRLEMTLNSLGALQDSPFHYQVLGWGELRSASLLTWPYYLTPKAVKEHDVDLVVMLTPPDTTNYRVWYENPPTEEGIPGPLNDPEWLLKPLEERAKASPLPDRFYRHCKERKVLLNDRGAEVTPPIEPDILADPVLRADLIELVGKPLKAYADKLGAIRTSGGKGVRFQVCFFPLGSASPGFHIKPYRLFWKDLGKAQSLGVLDLSDPILALRTTFFPITDLYDFEHYDHNGHLFMGQVLAHELIRQKAVPFMPGAK